MRSGNGWTFQANIRQNQILLKNLHAFQVESVTSLKFCLAISKHNQERTKDIKKNEINSIFHQILPTKTQEEWDLKENLKSLTMSSSKGVKLIFTKIHLQQQ